MNILGINAFGMNPAACLLQDGKCVAFAEEERFSRVKISEGLFPGRAVKYCLSYANLTLDSIDRIAFGWDCTKYPWSMVRNFASNYFRYGRRERKSFHKQKSPATVLSVIEGLTDFHPLRIHSKILEGFRTSGFNGDIPKTEFVPHHLSHAFSTYFCSGFDRAGIITMDGHGEDICTQLSIGENDEVRVVESFPIPHSLGWFYAAITEYLGFIPYRDEGKLMGLAAFGEKRKNNNKWIEPFSKILKIGTGVYEVNPVYTLFGGHYYGKRYTDEMVKLITDIDSSAVPVAYGEKVEIGGVLKSKYLREVYIDIAWAAQYLLEQTAVMLAKKMVNRYGVENLCISGGVALNCKMNGEILRQSGCKNIFVQPASNDAGTALGAAMIVAKRFGDKIKNQLKDVYCGPGYNNDEILSVLKQCKLNFQKIEDPAHEGAELLEEGKIIGWFQGRMEFGARALGNRSILANPVFKGIKDRVNNEVKYRESWRPFCPSIIEDVKNDYIENVNEASYMIVAYHAKESMKKNIGVVVHIDNTIRPQIVKQEVNPAFFSLIINLGKRTGHPVVLNTSFNIRGEPIICRPLEAVSCFYSNGLDALIMGNFLVRK